MMGQPTNEHSWTMAKNNSKVIRSDVYSGYPSSKGSKNWGVAYIKEIQLHTSKRKPWEREEIL